MPLPQRKSTRLKQYDYSQPGYYFITICTAHKQKLLCSIVGTDVPGGPQIRYTPYGDYVRNRLEEMAGFYQDIQIDKYVIMPNHIHFLIHIQDLCNGPENIDAPMNSMLARFISTFKRFYSRELGSNIWQARSHDHIIRGEKDYQKIWEYIDTNPIRWADDCFYCE